MLEASIFQLISSKSGMLASFTVYIIMLIIVCKRCFPHIVNLAVQAVLSSISNTNYEEENDDLDFSRWPASRDVIAILRTLINKV